MEETLIFCGVLSFGLGFTQVFFPSLITYIETYLDQLLNIPENSIVNFRKITGIILMVIGILLFLLVKTYDYDKIL